MPTGSNPLNDALLTKPKVEALEKLPVRIVTIVLSSGQRCELAVREDLGDTYIEANDVITYSSERAKTYQRIFLKDVAAITEEIREVLKDAAAYREYVRAATNAGMMTAVSSKTWTGSRLKPADSNPF